MAVQIRRFRRTLANLLSDIQRVTASGAATAATDQIPEQFVDVSVEDTVPNSLSDVGAFMESIGFTFVAGNPATALSAAAAKSPVAHVRDLLCASSAVTIVTVGAGECRDSADTIDMVVGSALALDITNTGALGRNVETAEAADTWYAIVILGDSTGVLLPSAMLVNAADLLTFAIPAGYDVTRRIGWARIVSKPPVPVVLP